MEMTDTEPQNAETDTNEVYDVDSHNVDEINSKDLKTTIPNEITNTTTATTTSSTPNNEITIDTTAITIDTTAFHTTPKMRDYNHKRVRLNADSKWAFTNRAEEQILSLVVIVKQLVTEVKELKSQIASLNNPNKTKPFIPTIHTKNINQTTREHPLPTRTGQGNLQVTPMTHPLTVKQTWVTVVGNRKNTVIIEKAQPTTAPEVPPESQNTQLTKLLTRPPPLPTQEVPITVIVLENVKSRKVAPAKVWRDEMKKAGIKPISILFPQLNTVEIIVETTQKEDTVKFASTIQRFPVNPDPYRRKDGKTEPLLSETILKIAQRRVQMLLYERNILGIRHLEESIKDAMKLMTPQDQSTLQQQLKEALQEKGILIQQ
jgi:hypothetical protein